MQFLVIPGGGLHAPIPPSLRLPAASQWYNETQHEAEAQTPQSMQNAPQTGINDGLT